MSELMGILFGYRFGLYFQQSHESSKHVENFAKKEGFFTWKLVSSESFSTATLKWK